MWNLFGNFDTLAWDLKYGPFHTGEILSVHFKVLWLLAHCSETCEVLWKNVFIPKPEKFLHFRTKAGNGSQHTRPCFKSNDRHVYPLALDLIKTALKKLYPALSIDVEKWLRFLCSSSIGLSPASNKSVLGKWPQRNHTEGVFPRDKLKRKTCATGGLILCSSTRSRDSSACLSRISFGQKFKYPGRADLRPCPKNLLNSTRISTADNSVSSRNDFFVKFSSVSPEVVRSLILITRCNILYHINATFF